MSEYTKNLSLVNNDGSVNLGWARHPVFDLNIRDAAAVKHHPFGAWRTKRWTYFYIAAPAIFFSGLIAHVGYLGNIVVYLYDLEHHALMEQSLNIPFGAGITLADHPRHGTTCALHGKSLKLESTVTPEGKHIAVHWPAFNGGRDLDAEISLIWQEQLESLNVVDPLKNGRFAYTTKVTCLPAGGSIRLGNDTWKCDPEETMAEIDWSRGFFENTTLWKWATLSGRLSNGDPVGLNLCSGFHDGGDNENALMFDGHVTKLGLVSFTYDPNSIMKPWHITSPDGRVDLTFTPIADRKSMTDLGIIHSHIHQLIGRYTGHVTPDNSGPLTISGIIGAAEDHDALW